MAIKESNSRVIITIPTILKDKLEALCINDKRTMSKEVEYILELYLNSAEANISKD